MPCFAMWPLKVILPSSSTLHSNELQLLNFAEKPHFDPSHAPPPPLHWLTAAGTTVSIILLFGRQLFVSLPAISASILTSGGNDRSRGWVHRYCIKHPVPGTRQTCTASAKVLSPSRAHVIHGYCFMCTWLWSSSSRGTPINKRTRRSVEHILE